MIGSQKVKTSRMAYAANALSRFPDFRVTWDGSAWVASIKAIVGAGVLWDEARSVNEDVRLAVVELYDLLAAEGVFVCFREEAEYRYARWSRGPWCPCSDADCRVDDSAVGWDVVSQSKVRESGPAWAGVKPAFLEPGYWDRPEATAPGAWRDSTRGVGTPGTGA